MKLKIPLSAINEGLVIRISKRPLEKSIPKKTSLSSIIELKMQFLLNAIYAICIDDVKEQEKRRKLIRLYTKETNELVKILTLLLASKHGSEINRLESKILKLQQYNKEQEELADMLVYKCSDLKLEASSSYDISRAINVLLYGEDNFPTEIKSLAAALTTKETAPKEYDRIDKLLHLHVKKAGIWQNEDVSYTVKNGIVNLFSYGFKSTLTMIKKTETEYAWHILSIKQTGDENRSISTKGIVFKNTIKEILDMTKYAYSVVQIEEIYRIFKNKAESKIFDLEISGTSKEFTVEVLGTYMVRISIVRDWNGPGIICRESHAGTSTIFKKDIAASIFTHIEKCLRTDFSPHVHISLERGLFYKDKPMHTLREIQKETEIEKASQKSFIAGLILKNKVNAIHNGNIIQLNTVIRANENLFLGLHWDEQHTTVRMFYGVFQMRSLLTAKEIPIIYILSGPKLHSPALSEDHVSSQGIGALHTNSPSTGGSGATRDTVYSRPGDILVETSYKPKTIINQIFEKASHILAIVSAHNELRMIKGGKTKVFIEKKIEGHILNSVAVKLEGAGKNKIHTTIISSRVSVEGRMTPAEIEKIVWVAAVTEGMASNPNIALPEALKKISITGQITSTPSSTSELMFSQNRMRFTLSYAKGSIICTSDHPLATAWARSVISAKSITGLAGIFLRQDVILTPRLISTLSIHNMLGGSLTKTCNSSIVYIINKCIEVYWMNQSEEISAAIQHIPKIKETQTHATISLDYTKVFLEAISVLLSNERIKQMGNTIRIWTNKTNSSVYRLEMHKNSLFCKKVEGIGIKNAELILEISPDPEKDLLDHFFQYLPNMF